MVQIFKNYSRLVGWNFRTISEQLNFCCHLTKIWGKFTIFNTRDSILMANSIVFITPDYVITIWYSHLLVLISELNQSKSVLKAQCFRPKKVKAEQCWFRGDFLWNCAEFFTPEQHWFRENQSWSALMFFMFSESALKNVKSLKQRCSALIIPGTSTRAQI